MGEAHGCDGKHSRHKEQQRGASKQGADHATRNLTQHVKKYHSTRNSMRNSKFVWDGKFTPLHA